MTDPSRDAFERAYPAAAADWHDGIQNYVAFAAHYEGWQAAMAHKEAERWRSIESAPKDGTLIVSDGSAVGEAFWHDGSECYGHRGGAGWFWECDRGQLLTASNCHPTLYQPLPAAPLPQGE